MRVCVCVNKTHTDVAKLCMENFSRPVDEPIWGLRPGQVLCGDHASLPSRQAVAPAPGCRVLFALLSPLASVVVYIVCLGGGLEGGGGGRR
jgi:hypothetical protein